MVSFGLVPKTYYTKGVAPNSKYGYGYNLRHPNESGMYDYALFFESAVDLLSFIEIKRNLQGKSLTGTLLVSMAGLKINVVEHMTKTFNVKKIVLCTDADQASTNFATKLREQGIQHTLSPASNGKDWNDWLSFFACPANPLSNKKGASSEDDTAQKKSENKK